MAQELDDGEFWLPSEFLTDDDLLMDFKIDDSKTVNSFGFGLGFGFGFSSDLSSPGESVMGETESDEDELLSGLTRKMANSTLQDAGFETKGLKLSGSPQSTLCGFKPGSNQSSPNSVSRVSSPTNNKPDVGFNLLSAAAGEVAKMRSADETAPFRSTQVTAPPPKPISGALPVTKTNPSTGYFYPNQAQTEAHLAYLQLQATHFQRIKQQQQQIMNNGVWKHEKTDYQFQNGKLSGEIGRTQGLSTAAWPTLQQSKQQQQQPQPGSGMRAVFLGETGAKKERTGTGVFLPRRFGANANPAESRKKQGSTTVLLPEKVVHALNLNLDAIDAQSNIRCNNRNFTPEYDAAVKQRNNILMAQQRRTNIPQPAMNPELRLPQEWTY